MIGDIVTVLVGIGAICIGLLVIAGALWARDMAKGVEK